MKKEMEMSTNEVLEQKVQQLEEELKEKQKLYQSMYDQRCETIEMAWKICKENHELRKAGDHIVTLVQQVFDMITFDSKLKDATEDWKKIRDNYNNKI